VIMSDIIKPSTELFNEGSYRLSLCLFSWQANIKDYSWMVNWKESERKRSWLILRYSIIMSYSCKDQEKYEKPT
jgi:hypothetical protein